METYDAIIIGSGHNALVAAAYLARDGWSTLVLEKNDRPGGLVRTDELTLPGFHHDVYAGWPTLFVLSRAYADLGPELAERGLTFANNGTPIGVSLPGGRAAVLTTDLAANVAEAERLAPGDGAAWAQLCEDVGQYLPQVLGLFSTDLASPEAAATIRRLMTGPDGAGLSPFAAEFMATARDVLEGRFRSEVWRGLHAPWVLHAGRGPESANSGFWAQVLGVAAQLGGVYVAIGGVEAIARALARLIEDHGGIVRTGSLVTRILVERGRAVGVRTAGGDEYRAGRVVIASTNPDQLYLRLLADMEVVPPAIRQQAGRYRYGLGCVQIHLALAEPPRWPDRRLDRVVDLHITPGLDGVSRSVNEATRGLLPAEPTIAFGVPTTLDPSRAPDGRAIATLQILDVPRRPRGDAVGAIACDGEWTDEVQERFADRVIAIVGRHAPDIPKAILDRAIVSPRELAAYNPNCGDGDPYGGAHDMAQSYLFRPLPGQPSHRTVVPNLYMVGAATWPGSGLGAGSGYIVAQQVLQGA